jgi:DNA polymerase I
VILLELGSLPSDCPYQQDELVVVYDAPATIGACIARGWPLPDNILDLHAEYRCLVAGLTEAVDQDAFSYFGVPDLQALWDKLKPGIDEPRALLRGRYAGIVATIEARGVPIDMEMLGRLRENWLSIRGRLIAEVDRDYCVYKDGGLHPLKWREWVNKNRLRWPRWPNRKLHLDLDTFKEMAKVCPAVLPIYELEASLAVMRAEKLAVDPDGRNRCPLRPFASKTGRNQPSTSRFIFGPAVWLRGLIQPPEGRALAYIDYSSQEFGIAAALSADPAMMRAYESGDPYLSFAKQARAIPEDGTKQSHGVVRDQFKVVALAIQYGMGEQGLATRLSCGVEVARRLISLHRRTFFRYHRWSDDVERRAFATGQLQARLGWTLQVRKDHNERSIRNFPLQANGAEMLRIACKLLYDSGVEICATVHDAILIEADEKDIADAVRTAQQGMERASEIVLRGFKLRTDSKVIRHPDRFMDPRGIAMWNRVTGLLPS